MKKKQESTIIPEWQKNIVRERIKESKEEDYVNWEFAKKTLLANSIVVKSNLSE